MKLRGKKCHQYLLTRSRKSKEGSFPLFYTIVFHSFRKTDHFQFTKNIVENDYHYPVWHQFQFQSLNAPASQTPNKNSCEGKSNHECMYSNKYPPYRYFLYWFLPVPVWRKLWTRGGIAGFAILLEESETETNVTLFVFQNDSASEICATIEGPVELERSLKFFFFIINESKKKFDTSFGKV